MLEDAAVGPLLSLSSKVLVPSKGRRAVLRTDGVVPLEVCVDVALRGGPCRKWVGGGDSQERGNREQRFEHREW